PHDTSAHTAPKMSGPNVQIGNATAVSRYASRSSAPADGNDAPNPCVSPRVAERSATICSAATTAEMVNSPNATTAQPTWMTSQYESRAGTSGPGGTYSTVTARPKVRNTSRTAQTAIARPAAVRASIRNTTTATSEPVMENSYMLPHGVRPVPTPRTPTPAASPTVASTNMRCPRRPMRSARCSTSRTGSGWECTVAVGSEPPGPDAAAVTSSCCGTAASAAIRRNRPRSPASAQNASHAPR